jgi:hypothetical protein
MAYTMGTCNYCGRRHFNFQKCDAREQAKAEAAALEPKPAELHIVYRPDAEWRPFGDRLTNYENRGGNLHLLPPRKP